MLTYDIEQPGKAIGGNEDNTAESHKSKPRCAKESD